MTDTKKISDEKQYTLAERVEKLLRTAEYRLTSFRISQTEWRNWNDIKYVIQDLLTENAELRKKVEKLEERCERFTERIEILTGTDNDQQA